MYLGATPTSSPFAQFIRGKNKDPSLPSMANGGDFGAGEQCSGIRHLFPSGLRGSFHKNMKHTCTQNRPSTLSIMAGVRGPCLSPEQGLPCQRQPQRSWKWAFPGRKGLVGASTHAVPGCSLVSSPQGPTPAWTLPVFHRRLVGLFWRWERGCCSFPHIS